MAIQDLVESLVFVIGVSGCIFGCCCLITGWQLVEFRKCCDNCKPDESEELKDEASDANGNETKRCGHVSSIGKCNVIPTVDTGTHPKKNALIHQ
jgi:hypothetical protein